MTVADLTCANFGSAVALRWITPAEAVFVSRRSVGMYNRAAGK